MNNMYQNEENSQLRELERLSSKKEQKVTKENKHFYVSSLFCGI